MKANALGTLFVLFFSIAFAGTAQAADGRGHDAHAAHGHDSTESLRLNDGKKWATDAALRKAMANIRRAMAASLNDIHANRFSADRYISLSRKIEAEVGHIIRNCKLEAQADAQSHLIVADLLAGSELMAGKTKDSSRESGAIKVIGALKNYGDYFDDPGFKPIEH
jgi:hypothetical protein